MDIQCGMMKVIFAMLTHRKNTVVKSIIFVILKLNNMAGLSLLENKINAILFLSGRVNMLVLNADKPKFLQ